MRRAVPLFLLAAATMWAADPGLLKLVMPDARVVIGMNVAQVKKTPFGKFVLGEFSASQDEAFDGFVKASGFDPREHITEVLVASPANTGSDSRLLLVRGVFDRARILGIARDAGATVEPYREIDVLSSNASPMAFAFLSDTLAVAGDPELVRGAIDRKDSGAGPSAALTTKINTLSSASDAWLVSTVPVTELGLGFNNPNIAGALKEGSLASVEQASLGATFGTAVKLSAELVAHTAKDAAALGDVLRFLSAMLVAGPQQPLLSDLDVKADGKSVKASALIPEAQLESFIRQAGN